MVVQPGIEFDCDRDIPDLTGRVVIVTGGTDALGKQSILELSKHNPLKIYLLARSQSKAVSTISEIHSLLQQTSSHPPPPINFVPLDLSSLTSVKDAATTFLSREKRLDILMCNAGVIFIKGVTQDGYEANMGINHLGHALLIRLLLPLLQQTATRNRETTISNAITSSNTTRVIILSSSGEALSPTPYPSPSLLSSPLTSISRLKKYGLSKLAIAHYALSLSQHYPESHSGVKFVAIHPGEVGTNIANNFLKEYPYLGKLTFKVLKPFFNSVDVNVGVKGQVWAATAGLELLSDGVEEVKEVVRITNKDISGMDEGQGQKGRRAMSKIPIPKSGEFYFPVAVEGKGSKASRDVELAEWLWGWTEEVIEPHLDRRENEI